MPKKRRLTDLYRRGKLVEFDDGEGSLEVWLQKPNRVEMESIYRRANAAKARFLLNAEAEDSEEFQSAIATVMEVDDQELLMTLALVDEFGRAKAVVEAQLESDPEGEWAKDDKLQSLYDSWQGDEENLGLKAAYAMDPEGETPEGQDAKAVLDELTRFQKQVDEAFKVERERIVKDHEGLPRLDLVRKAARTVIDNEANEKFMAEFLRQQIFYAVREPETRDKRYFATLAEVDLLDDTVTLILQGHINDFMMDVSEGKDSAATTASSQPSESDEKVDPSQPSGLEESAA